MLELRVGQARSVALALALIVATGPTTTAVTRPAHPAGSPPGAAATDDRIAELALSLGFDLERIFRFVADEIRYEPYGGILRGAGGTLDAGAGNSLDQAVLLAALLDESGIAYRFARGTLDEASAERLVEPSLMDATEAAAAAEVALGGGPFPARIEIQPPEAADPQEVAAIQAATQSALDVSEVRVSDAVTLITTALTDGGITLGEGSPISLMSFLPAAEITDHTWLQATQGPTWLDLDPTLGAEATVGATLAEVDQTLDALPDESRHVVRFEVFLEQVRGEELQTTPVIEFEGFADELTGKPITLAHVPPSAVHRLGVAIASLDGEARLAYHPILMVPEGTVVSTIGVHFGVSTGDIGGSSGLAGVFDMASPDPDAIVDGEASAEWLAVTVESPGMEPVTARRPVFDRIPADVRYGGEPTAADVQPIELIPFAEGGALDFAPLLGTKAFAISTRPANEPDMLARAVAPEQDMAEILAASYLGLRDVVGAVDTIDAGAFTFVDRPGVVSYSIDVGVGGGGPRLTYSVDIWHRSLSAIPTRGSKATGAGANLRAGVIEQVAERLAIDAGPQDPTRTAESVGVSSVFEAAADAGIPTLVLLGSMPSGISFEPRTRALIEEALQAGDAVIVPAEPVRVAGRDRLGWWTVDPVTGTTADMMDDGTASETVEIGLLLRITICAAVFAPAYFTALNAVFSGAAAKLYGVAAGAMTAFWIVKSPLMGPAATACLTGVA